MARLLTQRNRSTWTETLTEATTDEMTRRERLPAVLQGKPTDRVPVLSGHFNEWTNDWKAREPSYHNLVAFCRERCDGILSWGPRALNETAPGTSSPAARVERQAASLPGGGTEWLDTLHAGRGALTRRTLADGMPGGRSALQPTAEPITIPLNSALEENWMTHVDATLEHGRDR